MSGTGGALGGGGDIESRVGVLERGFAQINVKLELILSKMDRLELMPGKIDDLRVDVARLDERLKGTASSVQPAEIQGRVVSLPTTWQMITLVIGVVGTILGGAFLILEFGLPHTP